MNRYRILLCIVFAIICLACKKEQNIVKLKIKDCELEVFLKHSTDSLYELQMTVNNNIHNTWPLEYPVYRFDYGDVTGDGIPEIAVGVIKNTRFDPHIDKRLFLFRITDDYYIRPLWLGSRVSQPLKDFRIVREKEPAIIRTVEKEKSGNYLVAEYRWKGFGLIFNQFIEREISLQRAQKLLKDK